MRHILFTIPIVFALAGCEAHNSHETKVSESAARATALVVTKGGTVLSSRATYSHDEPSYSFAIQRPDVSGVQEVTISAMTGKWISSHHASSIEAAIDAARKPELGKH